MKSVKTFIIACLITTLGSSLTNIALAYRYLLNVENNTDYGFVTYAATIASLLCWPILGPLIDRRKDLYRQLPLMNFVLAGLTAIFVLSRRLDLAVGLVFCHTALSLYESTLLFKLLPLFLEQRTLKSVNMKLEQINSIGFVMAPLVAPFVTLFMKSDVYLFMLDALSFIISGLLYRRVFTQALPQELCVAGKGDVPHLLRSAFSIFREAGVKSFCVGLGIYLFGFSAMAYSLAVIAKVVSGGNQFLYALPILAMFGGRLVAMHVLEKMHLMDKEAWLLITGLLGSAVFLAPLGWIHNMGFLCGLEFGLGIFIAVTRYGERTYTQIYFPSKILGRFGAFRQALQIGIKLLSIPLVMFMFEHKLDLTVPVILGLCYLIAAGLLIFTTRRPQSYTMVA